MTRETTTSQAKLHLANQVDENQNTRAAEGWEEFFAENCPQSVDIVGKSRDMLATLDTIKTVAHSRCNPVLIVGKTGTGKEQVARAVHAWRAGQDNDFVAVNCAALTASLLESELFGHVRGAFTGADREKTGLFEAAACGTIFLDEISEMPLDLQAKLLRVLQEKKFRKVGGTKDISCNATIVASSNRELLHEVRENRFRQDLYYRLAIFPIQLPALNEAGRQSDIPLLAKFFAKTSDICSHDIEGFTPEAEQFLLGHDWPGNVRELKNVVDRALLLEQGKWITPQSIMLDKPQPQACNTAKPAGQNAPDAKKTSGDFSLETAEREFIMRALRETRWQRTRAAGLLGITRATLHAKLKRYGITPPQTQNPQAENHLYQPEESETLREACA